MAKCVRYDKAVQDAIRIAIKESGGKKKWSKIRRFTQENIVQGYMEEMNICR